MEEEIIQHFLHEHPLKLQQRADEVLTCEGCREEIWGQIYGCKNCKFFLHKSCTLLPCVKQHFCHPCPLILGILSDYRCSTCINWAHGFAYRCEQCCFRMDIKCSEMEPVSSAAAVSGSEREKISYFGHSHPLTRFTKLDYPWNCNFCGMECLGPAYACPGCNFHIHRSCVDISTPTIDNSSHPCPLILVPMVDYHRCSTCDNQCVGLAFFCGKCRFYLCSACFLMPAIRSNEYEIIECRFLDQRLILREGKFTTGDYGSYECTICEKICSGPAYVDHKNKFFHTSCIEIPEQIENFYHSSRARKDLEGSHGNDHSSLISLEKVKLEKCELCLKWCKYVYSCGKCYFTVGTECAFLKATVKHKGDNHPLTLVERIHGESQCNHCQAPCEIDSPVFRCGSCDFTLHLLCGPLPCSIKIKCHVHPLTLKEFVAEDGPNDDNYCCHVCEQHRNPRSCVYYCSDCQFIAEAYCGMSEVIAMLKGEGGAVELRSLGGVIKTKVITGETTEVESNYSPLDEILHSLQELQPKEYQDLKDKISSQKEKSKTSYKDRSTGEIYSDEHFEKFMHGLKTGEPSGNLKDFMLEQDEEFATLGNYRVARVHIPIMEALFAKYGDISHKSKLSHGVKSIYFLVLCGVIHKMTLSLADNVTEEQLHDWWSFLKFVEDAGFEVQFMFDYLRRVATAHYGFRSQKSTEVAKKKQEDEIKRISNKIIKLQREMETAKAKLDKFENITSTQLMAQCHDQALRMKLQSAASDGLL